MTVPFARVPDNLRVGLFFVEFDNSMANNATATQRTLLIGGMLSTGSTLPGIPQRVSSSDTVGELTGKGGILQAMMAAVTEQIVNFVKAVLSILNIQFPSVCIDMPDKEDIPDNLNGT